LACGGCFSPPVPPGQTENQVVVQDAERVLFARDAKTGVSTVWVEVKYSGLAKEFGWVLPLPKQPKVGVGSKLVFDALDARMAPKFTTVLEPGDDENCRNPWQGCVNVQPAVDSNFPDGTAGASADSAMGNDAKSVPGPGVVVLDEGQTGPYDFVVIKGTDAKALYEWLNARGYATPQKAVPILESHVKKGDVFVAIKLQNGAGVELIRPIALTMQDAEPCVPLRLTSIAASEDMTVVVTLAGPARAIPKNTLHAVVNQARLNWYAGAQNYGQVLAQAIDEAGGHAFVTEFAQPGTGPKSIIDPLFYKTGQLAASQNTFDLAKALSNGLLLTEESAPILDKAAGLQDKYPKLSATQRMAALKGCGQLWQFEPASSCGFGGISKLTPAEAKAIAVDGAKVAAAYNQDFAGPILAVATQLESAPMNTRMVLRISPAEMDRDPVFAFNATLPPVSNLHSAKFKRVCQDGWAPALASRLTLPSLGSWVLNGGVPNGAGQVANNALDARFVKAPAALRVELLDETGPPALVTPGQIGVLDAALAGATPGKKSLPEGMSVTPGQAWQPPQDDKPLTLVGNWPQPQGCEPKAGWQNGKVPPSGSVVQPDAGSDDSGSQDAGIADAAGTDSSLHDGGASDAGAPVPSPAPKDDGCTAGRGAVPVGAWVLLGGLALLAVRRRRKEPVQ